MKDRIDIFVFWVAIKIRWGYFHLHPGYLKFSVGEETYFFHAKTNSIHYNYAIATTEENND